MSHFLQRRIISGGSSTGTGTGNTYLDLPIDGGVKNGNVGASIINSFPFIEYFHNTSGFGSVSWNISIPSNFADGYNLPVTLFWSSLDNSIGNVNWVIEYNAFTPFTSNISGSVNSINLIQTTSGNSNLLLSTGNALVIPPISSSNSIIFINVKRVFDINDTYSNDVRLHLARVQYTAND